MIETIHDYDESTALAQALALQYAAEQEIAELHRLVLDDALEHLATAGPVIGLEQDLIRIAGLHRLSPAWSSTARAGDTGPAAAGPVLTNAA